MGDGRFAASVRFRLEVDKLEALIQLLQQRGYETYGPTVHAQTIVYAQIASARDLPRGWTDEQTGGHYRLRRRDDEAMFGFAVGPQGPKQLLFPPEEVLWDAVREGPGFAPRAPEETVRRRALVGVRACELAALGVQDRVFLQGPYAEPGYRSRRDALFIVAVDCCEPGGTCFCASLGTGPQATSGFDVVLTEVLDDGQHFFVAAPGSHKGSAVLALLALEPADATAVATANALVQRASERMGRTLDTSHLPELLYRNTENPRWSIVADRCLGCANCTLVCPTCFCSDIEDVTDLTGTTAQRRRVWDSCFTVDFSYLHGGAIRSSACSRYRQWLTHKLASWIDQFGVSGCVGCGRCITWCPVGIDLTEELAAIRAHDVNEPIPATHPEAIHGDT